MSIFADDLWLVSFPISDAFSTIIIHMLAVVSMMVLQHSSQACFFFAAFLRCEALRAAKQGKVRRINLWNWEMSYDQNMRAAQIQPSHKPNRSTIELACQHRWPCNEFSPHWQNTDKLILRSLFMIVYTSVRFNYSNHFSNLQRNGKLTRLILLFKLRAMIVMYACRKAVCGAAWVRLEE